MPMMMIIVYIFLKVSYFLYLHHSTKTYVGAAPAGTFDLVVREIACMFSKIVESSERSRQMSCLSKHFSIYVLAF